ncbi:hypothetical protein ABEW34_02420 [Paenibacillus algorifonticola]|uniref:hypothetical protein n=1 Tax=Paenibacillus algorifonticola TaxID=684063 RepID=UPI003D2AC7ED
MEEYETSRGKTWLWVLLFALGIGLLLAAFSIVTVMIKYVFSLLALYLIFQFFKRVEKLWARIMVIVLGLLFYFLAVLVYTAIQFINENPPPLA